MDTPRFLEAELLLGLLLFKVNGCVISMLGGNPHVWRIVNNGDLLGTTNDFVEALEIANNHKETPVWLPPDS